VPAIPRYWGASRGPLNARADGLLSMIVTAADDISEFLATRRARITPEQAGLPSYGRRRVPGLRREEVASLAGVSADYYRRLERGQVSGASELVLEALAGALQLDDAERAHLFDLARAASPVVRRRSRPAKTRIRPVVQRLLDQDLIGELSTRSEEFRVRWAAHNVRFHRTGTKRLHHPVVGELELSYETLTLDADDGLRMALYTAEAGSASQQALDLLGSWTATPAP
jgi:transcriptional regulator with XRE-family HTH domain